MKIDCYLLFLFSSFNCIYLSPLIAFFPYDCPEGWSEYTEGGGRFIISSGFLTRYYRRNLIYSVNSKNGSAKVML
jgi:hypothetical protein